MEDPIAIVALLMSIASTLTLLGYHFGWTKKEISDMDRKIAALQHVADREIGDVKKRLHEMGNQNDRVFVRKEVVEMFGERLTRMEDKLDLLLQKHVHPQDRE
jgi:hypothetical protein